MTLARSILVALAVLLPVSWTVARAADEAEKKPAAEKKETKKKEKKAEKPAEEKK
jgi:hypothetical protein